MLKSPFTFESIQYYLHSETMDLPYVIKTNMTRKHGFPMCDLFTEGEIALRLAEACMDRRWTIHWLRCKLHPEKHFDKLIVRSTFD